MASAINALAGSSAANSGATAASASSAAPSKELFLQLLVAQIKNQDPLNPADGTQFVSELAQFSELEQVMAIRQGVDQMNAGASAAAGDATASQGTSK